ncbi:MAG: single-stranded DNA-binding protein [Proteobacteria bacterium]|nr:single-stranded DNA-binding protein [Pseudomonadota bacterium]
MIRASIHGRLGADPVERTTRNDKAMVTVSVAVNAARHGAEEETIWISLAAFGRAAEALARHRKGDLLAAMGPLHRTRFTGRDGTEREGWSLTVEAIMSARTVRSAGGRKRDTKHQPSAVARDGTDDEMNDDIPF